MEREQEREIFNYLKENLSIEAQNDVNGDSWVTLLLRNPDTKKMEEISSDSL
jgi:hypothetical protein